MTIRFYVLSVIISTLLGSLAVSAAVVQTVNLSPGDSVIVNCPSSLSRQILSAQQWQVDCAASTPAPHLEFLSLINAAAHQRYGLYYPVTYRFQIPNGSSGLTAQYRFSAGAAWIALPLKTAADYFNGINAARFDYANHMAYLSAAFSPGSDALYLRVLVGQSEVPLTYLGMPLYYDNRHAAVTVTLDDWTHTYDGNFDVANRVLTAAHVYFTAGVVTQNYGGSLPDWSFIQNWLSQSGYLEIASHSRTHPCNLADYQSLGFDWEVTGSRDDILSHLTLLYPYVPAYLEPCGVTSPDVRQAITRAGFVTDRGWQIPPVTNTFSTWGQDGAYTRVLYSYDNWAWPIGTGGTPALRDAANSSFDAAYAAGGIYHLVDHPARNLWFSNSNLDQHIGYISNRNDVWYAGFGQLYLYHYVQERGQVSVTQVSL
jgi:hypothetical protein